jgi:pimeloyl-ACP methyl ester carboxylesterase
MVDFVMSARAITGGKFDAEPGEVKFLRVPANASVPKPEHAVKKSQIAAWVREVQGLADGDENPNSISPRGDVLIFIHGYNNDLDIIMKRQRRLAADLAAEKWHGIVIGFDWPSGNETLNYYEDRQDAASVASHLVSDGIVRLAKSQEQGCETNVHVLGHSTGAYVIMEACAQAEKIGALFQADWRIGQVALIGGDIASNSLAADDDWSKPMFKRIMRLTNYSNPYDAVLAVSNAKRLGTSPRAGRVGLPVNAHAKAVNVNCGEYFQTLDPDKCTFYGTFNHSWHIGNRVFARDLAMTLEGAIDRNAIPTRRQDNGKLVLRDAPRPKYMAKWDIPHPPIEENPLSPG